MKTIILIFSLLGLWMLFGADGEAIISFLRKSIIIVLLILFLIPTIKGLFGAVKEE